MIELSMQAIMPAHAFHRLARALATLLLWSGTGSSRARRARTSAAALATIGRLILVLAILLPFTFTGLTGKLPLFKRRDWIVLHPSA